MTGITIESGFFSTKTTFELYPAHKRVVLLYGKNGCGKSTIAQGFREYANHKTPVGVELSPTKNGKVIQESTGQQGKIFVFDEEYVATRVQIKEDGLNAIVLFGEQIELEAQIARVENDISGKQIEIKNQEAECAEFTTSSNVKAPEYWTNRISGELKKSAGWADNGAKIKGNKINLSVSSDTINRLGGLSPARPQAELQEEFDRRYAQFKVVDSTTKPLPLVPPISIVGDKGAQAQDLLAKAVARPQWTPREKEIFDILGGQGLDAAKTYLSNTKVTVCDKCLQPISEEYRAAALRELACLLNRDIEEFKNELKQLLIPETAAAVYQIYSVLPSYCAVRDRIDDYNKAVYAHNDAVNAKIDNPFDSFEYPDSSVLIAANEAMSQALAMLKDDCALYNCSIKERDKVAKELQTINDELAHYAIDSMYASLKTQRDAKDDADKLLNKRYEELQALRKAKEQLNAKRRNFKLAANEINRSLEYIFYCKGRLTLELGADERYYLQVNGRKVAPNKVSCGERNALALSYFFTEIASNANTSAPYADEMLLVIDDPVSSFDFENKIGIQSLLRWKLEQVLGGCATSKALIMSHDISVVFDMGKGLKEIEECFKGKGECPSNCVNEFSSTGNGNRNSAFRTRRIGRRPRPS
jgi:energy-coupling factor transporter ATP-binding protein EcfA2